MTNKLIYIADDEPELCELMREVLEMEGFDVRTTPDGPALLQAVHEKLPDAILLDINMPGLTGWQVRQKLADDELTRTIPVLAVSAQGGYGVERSAEDVLGFEGMIRKPFALADLVEAVNRAVTGEEAQ